jgi:anti-sigma factor RsiW
MVDSKEPNDEVWSRTGPHEEFLELCALATAGGLSAEEQNKLQEHLSVCPDCWEAMKQFETVVDHTVPAMAPELGAETPQEDPSFPQEAAETSFLKRIVRRE